MNNKWSIFLNITNVCPSQRGTGNRPCDRGVPCDSCHHDLQLQEQFEKVKDSIDESLYCKYCGHLLHEDDKEICYKCKVFDELFI